MYGMSNFRYTISNQLSIVYVESTFDVSYRTGGCVCCVCVCAVCCQLCCVLRACVRAYLSGTCWLSSCACLYLLLFVCTCFCLSFSSVLTLSCVSLSAWGATWLLGPYTLFAAFAASVQNFRAQPKVHKDTRKIDSKRSEATINLITP